MLKKFFFSLFLLLPLSVFADNNSFNLVCDKGKYYIDDQFICRISINSDLQYDQISFNYNFSEGLELVDVRSNYDKVWEISNDNNKIVAKSKDGEVQTGLQEYGILLFKATKDGVLSINLNNIDLLNKEESIKKFEDLKEDVKIISANNDVKSVLINDKEFKDYKTSEKIYDIVTTDEKINVLVNAQNEFAKVIGNGEYTFEKNSNELIVPIKIVSENENQRIIVFRFYKNKDLKIVNALEQIILNDNNGSNLLLSFKNDVYDYYLSVNSNTTDVNILPTLTEGTSDVLIKNYGKQTLKLMYGDNLAIIKVKNNEGAFKNYLIFVTKTIKNASANNYINNLKIDGYELEFSKKVKNYKLEIRKNTKSLKITPVLDDEKATYVIKGNENLTDGSIIKIIVTAENGASVTYQLTINYKTTNYFMFILILFGTVGVGYGVYKFVVKMKQKKKVKPVVRIKSVAGKKAKSSSKNNGSNKGVTVKKKPQGTNKNGKKKSKNKKIKKTNTKNKKKKKLTKARKKK